MRATFFGFEIAKTGIQSAETGLDVTGQNMAKMNTEGYSRQVLEQSAVYYNTTSYKYAPAKGAMVGQGVLSTRIGQIRDQFLDTRYRTANSDKSQLDKTLSVLTGIEDVLDETLSDGVLSSMDDLYKSLQVYSQNAGDVEQAGLVRASAQKLTNTLNFYSNQLDTINEQEKFDLSVSVSDINNLLEKITKLNDTIQFETLQSNPTNELLDTRNLYLDKLSSYINITTEANSDGTVSIKTGTEYIIDAKNSYKAKISLDDNAGVFELSTSNGKLDVTSGLVKGYFDTLNGKGIYAAAGENSFNGIKYYKSSIDDLASALSKMFSDLNGSGKPLFEGSTAADIGISQGWQKDAKFITASVSGTEIDGQNNNILRMISALDSDTAVSPFFNGTLDEFALKLIADVAIDKKTVSDISETSGAVLRTIDNQRESVKGVSLNEETVNLLKYQKAFEASSRIITALDEMLDTIINRMGTVGR